MDNKLEILRLFFEDPQEVFYIREIARTTNLSPMTIRTHLNQYCKENLIKKKKTKLYEGFIANEEDQGFKNLKLFYNLEQLRSAKLIANLEECFEYPTIILFGSYVKATNVKQSDIDICIITDVKKEFPLEKYEKILKRSIDLHKFSEKEFKLLKSKNPELINNICNGLVLSGKLEVLMDE